MRIPDQLAKCVGFVSSAENTLQYRGTAFVVIVPYDQTSGCLHLVTAKHVAIGVGDHCIIAINGRDGLPLYTKSEASQWFYHPTEADSVDVAVLPFATARTDEYDIQPIPIGMFATHERIEKYSIGLGDEIFTIGLFTKFFGSSKLTPIVRTGNIAMMPTDQVPLNNFGKAEVYLVESRSIGGLSGSPVFCRNTLHLQTANYLGQSTALSGLGNLSLLGVVHGHWDLPAAFSSPERAEAVNMGVSIVIPAKKILETLDNPELVAEREKAFAR